MYSRFFGLKFIDQERGIFVVPDPSLINPDCTMFIRSPLSFSFSLRNPQKLTPENFPGLSSTHLDNFCSPVTFSHAAQGFQIIVFMNFPLPISQDHTWIPVGDQCKEVFSNKVRFSEVWQTLFSQWAMTPALPSFFPSPKGFSLLPPPRLQLLLILA
jgi:hypothetical protein